MRASSSPRSCLLLSAFLAGVVFASACGRATVTRGPDADSTGGTTSDITGMGGSGGGIEPGTSVAGGNMDGGSIGGVGGTSGPGSSSAGTISTGGTGGSIYGPSPFGSSSVDGSITGGTGGNVGGVCDEAPCLAPLALGCAPSGACTIDSSSLTGVGATMAMTTYCYANGVREKMVTEIGNELTTGTFTVERDGNPCYSYDLWNSADGSTATYTYRDSDGNQIATWTKNRDTSSAVVTCNGSTPIRLRSACISAFGITGSCVPGACTL